MDGVSQKVLNWLHSVLVGNYANVNAVYSDVASTLAAQKALKPSTDIYTFEDGRSALLLKLAGGLPVPFRGQQFSFPVAVWVPQNYPAVPPMVFVTASSETVVRPSQHVSSDGRLYHPYLAGWVPGRSSITGLVHVMQDVFSKEPPIMARSRQSMSPAPLPPPKMPENGSRIVSAPISSQGQPPPPPPKPTDQGQSRPTSRYDAPPPLPPPIASQQGTMYASQYGEPTPPRQAYPQRGNSLPPQSPQSPSFHQFPPHIQNDIRNQPRRVSEQIPPSSYSPQQQQFIQNQPASPTPMAGTGYRNSMPPQPQYQQGQAYPYPTNNIPPQPLHQQPKPKPQQQDLLTSTLDRDLPDLTNQPAPPIPPNPEKDALLHLISQQLHTNLTTLISQNAEALPTLSLQRSAMQSSMSQLEGESSSLASLKIVLESNEQILHTAMRDADTCILNAKRREVPSVDEFIVAPSRVAQQMYELVAEQKACVSTREVLAKALDRGTVNVDVWTRVTRGLAREEFKMLVLLKMGAQGMGLDGGGEGVV